MRKFVLFLFLMMFIGSASAELEAHFLNVGHGDCSIVTCDGHVMIIDGGSPGKSDMLYSYLNQMGVSHVDAVIATHPDSDHIGGLPAAFHVATVDTLYVATMEHESDRHNTLIRTATEKGSKIIVPENNSRIELGGALITFLLPNSNSSDDNEMSIIVMVEYEGTRLLFCADATKNIEVKLLEEGVDVDADIMKVAHHGSDSSSMMQFITAVSPRYAIISGNSRYSSPQDEVPAKLLAANAELMHTMQNGTIVFRLIPGEDMSISCGSVYVGNKNSSVFHQDNCPSVSRMKESNQHVMYTREGALQKGYTPCKNCQP